MPLLAAFLAIIGLVINYIPWVNGNSISQYHSACSTILGSLSPNCGYANGIFYVGWLLVLIGVVIFIIWLFKDEDEQA